MLGGTLTGKKLPAYVIIKSKGVKLLTGLARNVRVAYREKGSWVDRPQMKHYIKTVKSTGLTCQSEKEGWFS